tara:strand:+ start:72 stop:368 length:297 start_codon:yes stop_codon:yes gene_type:complete
VYFFFQETNGVYSSNEDIVEAYSKPPLPRTSLFFIRKTLKCVLSEGSHTVKNPGYRDFKSSYWKKILGTEISNPLLEENPGCRDFKSWYWKKIPVTGI